MWNDHNNYCQYLLSLIMSGVALCISIFCLIYLLPAKNISFDYIGVIVGILSILVTVLMTWNIFSVIDFKEKTKKVELLEKKQKDALCHLFNNMAVSQYSVYLSFKEKQKWAGAVTALVGVVRYMMYDGNFKYNLYANNFNIQHKNLKEAIGEFEKGRAKLGLNNIHILNEHITEICRDKNYPYISYFYDNDLKGLKAKIYEEQTSNTLKK